jgi:hypothetical protein
MQGLLPGIPGSAARWFLGLLAIDVEVDKRKLYFLELLIFVLHVVPCLRIFLMRLIQWKWNHTDILKGFIPDIVLYEFF